MKIDETIRTRQDTETLIQRLGAYDADLFDELQNKQHSDSELRKLIHEKTQELEKFPKKSRHGQEWFEKYQKKYEELKTKHSNCSKVLEGMTDLSNNVTHLKEKNLQDTFHGLREAFMETFKFIVPQGCAELKLVTSRSEVPSQKTFASQFPDPSQAIPLTKKTF